MSAFVCGTELNDEAKAEALKLAPKGLRKDTTRSHWLASHGFYVTASGSLDKRHKQAWPLKNSTASSAPASGSV